MSTNWSLEEDQVMYDCYYGDETARAASDKLPGRTRNACIGRAARLGFRRDDPLDIRKRKPLVVVEPLKVFEPLDNLPPPEFERQCHYMDENRCRMTIQPGSELCAGHQTQRYLEG